VSLFDEVLDLFGWAPPASAPKPSAAPPSRPAPAPTPAAAPAPPRERRAPLSARPAEGRGAGEALAIVRQVAPQFQVLVYTRNRRIMASVAERGRALRLNVAFAQADEAVLVSVARLFTARDARTRSRAREAVRAFIRGIPADAAGPARRRPRTREVLPGDERHIERLVGEFRRINAAHFGGALPEVPVYLSGAMRRRNGHFCSHPLEIVISRRLCTHAAPGESEHTMRHEMIHLWQHAQGKKPDHGAEFRAWARALDVHPRATRRVTWKGQGKG
jgi:hypothetical protein